MMALSINTVMQLKTFEAVVKTKRKMIVDNEDN